MQVRHHNIILDPLIKILISVNEIIHLLYPFNIYCG